MNKRIFIVANHGLSIVYFLQSELVSILVESGAEVVILTDGQVKSKIQKMFNQPNVTVESLRLEKVKDYWRNISPTFQYWLDFLRRAGASNNINLEAVRAYVKQVEHEAHRMRKLLFPLIRVLIFILRNSQLARKTLVKIQHIFTPNIYSDLFEKYKPGLVVASTPGWRQDRYILREAIGKGITTASVIIGWDNTSSYSLPGAKVDWITCWSEIQKDELVDGSDWNPNRVNIGGIPSYDGYFREEWKLSRAEYFEQHSLDPTRKLISYACSFISFSPNIQNIEALVNVITGDQLAEPSQLLIRLHPNHFLEVPRFKEEKKKITELAVKYPSVHLVEPVALGGDLGYYSGEDMPEKSSMMAHSDIMVTVYSTMALEASIHGTPVISLCIDSLSGWPDNFSLKLSQIGEWPTHTRFTASGAGREAQKEIELKEALDYYLINPNLDDQLRQAFVSRECTYVDGSAGKKTSEFLLSLLEDL
ncbi:MAG: hypothetical protein MUO54_14440 [Anaerolineales bacterium]|nr:hypothetical protein [Anaerolineales bacterium]